MQHKTRQKQKQLNTQKIGKINSKETGIMLAEKNNKVDKSMQEKQYLTRPKISKKPSEKLGQKV